MTSWLVVKSQTLESVTEFNPWPRDIGQIISPVWGRVSSSVRWGYISFNMYLFQRERERERERETPKQAPGSELSTQSPTWGWNSRSLEIMT